MNKTPTFICAECGERRRVAVLSEQSLHLANTASRALAVEVLPDYELVCRYCDNETSIESLPLGLIEHARSSSQVWEFSGVYVDPARLQAYHLNY